MYIVSKKFTLMVLFSEDRKICWAFPKFCHLVARLCLCDHYQTLTKVSIPQKHKVYNKRLTDNTISFLYLKKICIKTALANTDIFNVITSHFFNMYFVLLGIKY